MPKDNNTSLNRRNVLKSVAGATALTSFTSTAKALQGSAKNDTLAGLTSTETFERLESELGSVSVDATESRIVEIDDRTMRAELETEYGTMGAIRIEGDDETLDIALLDLADVKGQALPDHLEGAGAARKETQPLLFTTSDHDQVHFRRDATEAEKRILARKTDIRYANLEATFETEVGGFVVAAHDGTDAGYTTVELDGAEYREVAPGQINGATVTRNVQPQSCTWDCTRCLAKAGKCTGCCLAANVGCIACIIWQCGVGASVCHDCYDCLS